MKDLKFERVNYPKYQSAYIIIKNAGDEADDEDVIEDVQEGKYNTNSVPITLSKKHLERMKQIEEEVNDYLVDKDKVKLVYGNKMYPKIKKDIRI